MEAEKVATFVLNIGVEIHVCDILFFRDQTDRPCVSFFTEISEGYQIAEPPSELQDYCDVLAGGFATMGRTFVILKSVTIQ